MYRDLLRNITWLGAASLLVKPFWLLFLIAACPRLLGWEGYGVMTAALALGAIGSGFSDWGMSQYTLREVARARRLASRFFTNFVLLRSGLLVLGGCVAVGAALVLDYQGAALRAVVYASLYWAATVMTLYCRIFFRAYETLRLEAVSTVLEKVVVLAIAVPLLVITRAPDWTLAGMALGMVLTLGGNIAWVAARLAPLRLQLASGAFIRRTLPAMAPLGIAGLLTIFYLRTDMVMVEAMLGEAEAGQYGQAFRMLEALSILPFIVAQSALFPRFAGLYHAGARADFEQLLRRGMAGLVAVALGVAAALTVLAPLLIRLLVDEPGFTEAAQALQVLCWTFPFTCASQLLYVALISREQQRFPVLVLALATLLNIGLNFLFIPRYGISGAAFMTVASEIFIVVAYTYRYYAGASTAWQKTVRAEAVHD